MEAKDLNNNNNSEQKQVPLISLRFAENLSLPTFQVIVMTANVSCSHCQERVSQVISKMDELLDCVVDVRTRQVILRGLLNSNSNSKKKKRVRQCKYFSSFLSNSSSNKKRFTSAFLLHQLIPSCFTSWKSCGRT